MKTLWALFFIVSVAPVLQAQQAAGTCNGWLRVASPNLSVQDNVLTSLAANSSIDIWPVGQYITDKDPNFTHTLAQHYDGSEWSVVTTPDIGPKANAFFSVTATGGGAWAVGYFIDSKFNSRSLIEAWDGSAWNIVDHPHAGQADLFFGVSALSPYDIWAVGTYLDSSGIYQNLTEHFDGNKWSIVDSPSAGSSGNQLYAVLFVSSQSAWAVGGMTGQEGPDQATIQHWDGNAWSSKISAVDGISSTLLYGVTGNDSHVVAVGDAQDNIVNPRTLVEIGSDGHFTLEKSLNIGAGENHFYTVTSAPSGPIWAAGEYADDATGNTFTLIARAAPSGWVQETTPSPGQANGGSQLGGILALSPTDVWAVGAYNGSVGLQTLVLHRCQ